MKKWYEAFKAWLEMAAYWELVGPRGSVREVYSIFY